MVDIGTKLLSCRPRETAPDLGVLGFVEKCVTLLRFQDIRQYASNLFQCSSMSHLSHKVGIDTLKSISQRIHPLNPS